ncbi:hypothetical protein M9435_000991 [Picochlorum sp. BPE23]|nr:hypothetical protein M9435_000991 [Picochlorum sp. BPE23]
MAQIIGNESDTTTKAVPNPTSLAAQVLGNPTIRQKIVSHYYNPYNIYHMRALLSLYAIGMLPQEELKEHIARRYLAVRCGVHLQKDKPVDFRYHRKMYVNLDTEDWQMELDEMCIDYDEELSKEEFEKMAEYRALRYIPSHVYETIKNGSQALAVFNKGKCTAEDLEEAFSCPELTQIYACQVGAVYPILARMMNKTGIPMSYQDQDDRCLLHYACEFGHAHLVAPIFREGVKEGINVAQAAFYWKYDVVKYLVESAKARVDVRDGEGNTAMDYALKDKVTKLVDYFKGLEENNASLSNKRIKTEA